MKKLISLCLAVLLAALPVSAPQPARAAAAPSYNAAAADAAGELIRTGILRKYIDSDTYAYWNFYISSDTNLLSAYAYRYADAVSHVDLVKTIRCTVISKDDAKDVLESYMQEFLAKNSEKYASLVTLQKLISLADQTSESMDPLLSACKRLTKPQLAAVKTELSQLKKDEPMYENALASRQLDPTAEKWAVEKYAALEDRLGQLGVRKDDFEALSSLTVALSWGLKLEKAALQWDETRTKKYNFAMAACYAAQDCLDFYTLVSQNAINDNVRAAAAECADELEKFRGKSVQECIAAATAEAKREFGAQTFLDSVGSKAGEALEAAVPILKAMEAGVKTANLLFNVDKTTEQVNKIRVMAVISLALADEVCECETDYTASWRDLPAKEDASNRLLRYTPMLMLARELGERQYYNMRQSAGSGALSKLLSLFLGSDTTLEGWYKSTTASLEQMRAQAEKLLSAAKADPSNVSEAEKQKISAYLSDIADLDDGSMPPFGRIEDLDKTWTVQSLWKKVASKNYINYTAENDSPESGAVSLAAIEKEARSTLNPSVSLPATGDYSSFKGQNVLTPRWVPSQKLFVFPPADFGTVDWVYPISSVVKSGDTYKVACAELYYAPTFGLTDLSVSTGVLFNNGKRVGTETDATESAPVSFHYETDPTKLPQLQFILKANGSGGYCVLAKSGAQSQCKFPEDEDAGSSSADSSSAPASSSGGELTLDQALDLALSYYRKAENDSSDLSTSVSTSNNQTYNGETCCLVEVKKGSKDQEQIIAKFLVGLQSGNLYRKNLQTGQFTQVKTGSAGSAETQPSAAALTQDQACKMATDYVKTHLHPSAPILTIYGDDQMMDGENCYNIELRENDGDHASMLGMFLVGKNSKTLYKMDISTGDYKKAS